MLSWPSMYPVATFAALCDTLGGVSQKALLTLAGNDFLGFRGDPDMSCAEPHIADMSTMSELRLLKTTGRRILCLATPVAFCSGKKRKRKGMQTTTKLRTPCDLILMVAKAHGL